MGEQETFRAVGGRVVRDIATTDPQLLAALAVHQPGIEGVRAELAGGLTVPSHIRATNPARGFVRLPEGHRTVYRTDALPGDAVIGIKGAEPALDDFGELLHWMRWSTFRAPPQYAHMTAIDHFPLVEHKVPGCVTVDEATREFDTAAALQRAHLDRFGELARLPFPLVVHELPAELATEVADLVGLVATPAATKRAAALIARGLAVLVYQYPAVPHRAGVVGRRRAGESEAARLARVSRLDPERTIRRWSQLFARLLLLSYLPYTFQNERLGALFDPGNATIDGGFVDVDSAVPITDLGDDPGAIHDAVAGSLLGLVRTVAVLLPQFDHAETADLVLRRYVTRLVEDALEEDATPDQPLHPSVKAFLSGSTFDEVVALLSSRSRFTTPFV